MRDLRAELRERDAGIPIEWKPVDGDILVGSVSEASSDGAVNAGQTSVVVEEERTGLPFLISLESPHLAALFELHNPRGQDRIGIKCTGVGRFTMVIDRGSAIEEPPAPAPALSETTSENGDNYSTATPEERDYIAQMLAETSTEDSHDAPKEPITGFLRRQEEELTRQARALERLEALIAPAASPAAAAEDASARATDPEAKPSAPRRRSWLRALLLWITLFIAGAIGAAAAVLLKPAALVWLGW